MRGSKLSWGFRYNFLNGKGDGQLHGNWACIGCMGIGCRGPNVMLRSFGVPFTMNIPGIRDPNVGKP